MNKYFISLLLLFFAFSVFAQKDCPEECSKSCLSILKKYEVDNKDWKKALKEKNKQVYRKLEKLLVKEDYFIRPKIGVGCFYFYLVYSELAASVENDAGFKQFLLDSDVDIQTFQQRGLTAVSYAREVLDHLNENYDADCERNLKEITFKQYMNGLAKNGDIISKDLWLPDLEASVFEFQESPVYQGDTLNFRVVVNNIGKGKLQNGVKVELTRSNDAKSVSQVAFNNIQVSTDTLLFTNTYDSVGTFTATISIDPENIIEEKNKENNVLSKEVIVKKRIFNIIRSSSGYDLLILVNSNERKDSELLIKLESPDESRSNCIKYVNLFPKNTASTELSREFDETFFNETLKPLLENKRISFDSLEVRITGFADGQIFQSGKTVNLPLGMNLCKGGDYWVLGADRKQLKKEKMSDLRKISSNQQLAYVRASYAKQSLIKYLDVQEEKVVLQILESNKVDDFYRAAVVEICGPVINDTLIMLVEGSAKRSLTKTNLNEGEKTQALEEDRSETKGEEIGTIDENTLRRSKTIDRVIVDFNGTNAQFEISLFGENLQRLIEKAKQDETTAFILDTKAPCREADCLDLSRQRSLQIFEYLYQSGIEKSSIYKTIGEKPSATGNTGQDQTIVVKLVRIVN